MIDQVIHRIKLRQTELQVALAVGMPVTWEAYQRMVGEHQGLQIVMDFIDQILEEDKNGD